MGEDREEGAHGIAQPAAPPGSPAGHPPGLLGLWLPPAAMMGVQLWLSSQSRLPAPLPGFAGADKVAHAAWFFALGLLVERSLRLATSWTRGRVALAVVLGALLWGISDEFHQSFVPGRSVEAADVAADVAGAAAAALVGAPLLRRLAGRP